MGKVRTNIQKYKIILTHPCLKNYTEIEEVKQAIKDYWEQYILGKDLKIEVKKVG